VCSPWLLLLLLCCLRCEQLWLFSGRLPSQRLPAASSAALSCERLLLLLLLHSASWSPAEAAAYSQQWAAGSASGSCSGLSTGLDLLGLSTYPATAAVGSACTASSPPASPQPLLATRITAQDALLLYADMWLLQGASSAAGSAPVPLQRGVASSPGVFSISAGAGDARPGMPGVAPPGSSSNPFAYLGLSGLQVGVSSLQWTLTGWPSALLQSSSSSSSSVSLPHVLTLSSGDASVQVPPGTLRCGYIYSASLSSSSLNASISASSPSFVSDVWRGGAAQLSSALIYVHLPPRGIAVVPAPGSGQALLTSFNLSASGGSLAASDAAVRSAAEPSYSAAAAFLGSQLPFAAGPWAAVQGLLSGSSASDSATALSSSTLAALTAFTSSPLVPGCPSVASAQGGSSPAAYSAALPAWLLELSSLAGAAGLNLAPACSALSSSLAELLLKAPGRGGHLSLPVNAAPLSFFFRVASNATSGSVSSSSSSSSSDFAAWDPAGASPDAAAAAAAALSVPNSWLGSALAPRSQSSSIRTVLTLPVNASGATSSKPARVQLFLYVADGEGSVGVGQGSVQLQPTLSSADALDTDKVASTVELVAKAQLGEDSIFINPLGSLLTINSLGGLLTFAAGGGSDSTGSSSNRSSVTAEQTKTNSDLRSTLAVRSGQLSLCSGALWLQLLWLLWLLWLWLLLWPQHLSE
jgi:hypothetical protein